MESLLRIMGALELRRGPGRKTSTIGVGEVMERSSTSVLTALTPSAVVLDGKRMTSADGVVPYVCLDLSWGKSVV